MKYSITAKKPGLIFYTVIIFLTPPKKEANCCVKIRENNSGPEKNVFLLSGCYKNS